MIVAVVLAAVLSQPRMIPPNERRAPVRVEPQPCQCVWPLIEDLLPMIYPPPVDGDHHQILCWVNYSGCYDRVIRDYARISRETRDCQTIIIVVEASMRALRACEHDYRDCIAGAARGAGR